MKSKIQSQDPIFGVTYGGFDGFPAATINLMAGDLVRVEFNRSWSNHPFYCYVVGIFLGWNVRTHGPLENIGMPATSLTHQILVYILDTDYSDHCASTPMISLKRSIIHDIRVLSGMWRHEGTGDER